MVKKTITEIRIRLVSDAYIEEKRVHDLVTAMFRVGKGITLGGIDTTAWKADEEQFLSPPTGEGLKTNTWKFMGD